MMPKKDAPKAPGRTRAASARAESKLLKERIKKLSEAFRTQAEFAAALRVSASRIPEYLTGRRKLPGQTLIRLGSLAMELGQADPYFFWKCAGVEAQDLRSMTHRVLEGARAAAGELIPILRFRETAEGRESAGPPLLLPAEVIPNALATECISIDEGATAVVEAPRGFVILDTSSRGAQDLHDLWGHVVMLRYAAPLGRHDQWPEGLYMGRLQLQEEPGQQRNPNYAAVSGWLDLLGRQGRYKQIYLGKHVEESGMEGVSIDNIEGWYRRMKDIRERASSSLALIPGLQVLGQVIGRLSGKVGQK